MFWASPFLQGETQSQCFHGDRRLAAKSECVYSNQLNRTPPGIQRHRPKRVSQGGRLQGGVVSRGCGFGPQTSPGRCSRNTVSREMMSLRFQRTDHLWISQGLSTRSIWHAIVVSRETDISEVCERSIPGSDTERSSSNPTASTDMEMFPHHMTIQKPGLPGYRDTTRRRPHRGVWKHG